MRARVVALFCAALVSLLGGPARAAMMTHSDLTSLALMSEAVVLARRTGQRQLAWDTVQEHRVVEVYAGSLQPGDTVEVSYGATLLAPLFGWPKGTSPVVSDDVVLFLTPMEEGSDVPEDAGSPPAWRLVPSGLRIFADGKAYRFEQHQNPGPYEPVPQGRDPFDVMGDPRGGQALDRPALLQAVQRAVERAKREARPA